MSKPFLSDVKKPSEQLIISVKPNKKGSGLLITTENWIQFVWKDSTTEKLLTTVLKKYISDGGKGKFLMVVPNSKAKDGVTITVHKDTLGNSVECSWVLSPEGAYRCVELSEEDVTPDLTEFF